MSQHSETSPVIIEGHFCNQSFMKETLFFHYPQRKTLWKIESGAFLLVKEGVDASEEALEAIYNHFMDVTAPSPKKRSRKAPKSS